VRDFGDLFRLEGHVGYGLQAHAAAGEILHAGVGSSQQWGGGLVYGRAGRTESMEDHLPLSIVWSLTEPDQEGFHRIVSGPDGSGGRHRCFLIFPGAINPCRFEKEDIHYFDVEAGFLAGLVGAEVGFSIGEFVDWVLGFFKFTDAWTFLDPAEDDTLAARRARRLWVPRRSDEPILPPQ
jgi:hypothetical protein